jgi:hypothetical protein
VHVPILGVFALFADWVFAIVQVDNPQKIFSNGIRQIDAHDI